MCFVNFSYNSEKIFKNTFNSIYAVVYNILFITKEYPNKSNEDMFDSSCMVF